MVRDLLILSASQPSLLSMSHLLCSVFACLFSSTSDFTHLVLIDGSHHLLSKPPPLNVCKGHHHSPACSSRNLGVLPDFGLFFIISVSNPSANTDQHMFRAFHALGYHSSLSHRHTLSGLL